MPRTDEQIIEAVLKGDKEAFGELIDNYTGLAYSICLSYAGNTEDARDLVQETFIKAYLILRDLREPAAFCKWICRIASSVSINYLRSQPKVVSIDRFDLGTVVAHSVFGTHAHHDDSPDDDRVLLIGALDQALGELPEKLRLCIILKYVEGLRYAQISEFLGIGTSTVKNRIHHAKIILRNKLKAGSHDCTELLETELLATGTHG